MSVNEATMRMMTMTRTTLKPGVLTLSVALSAGIIMGSAAIGRAAAPSPNKSAISAPAAATPRTGAAAAGAPVTPEAPKVKVERGAGGHKVYRITEEIRIEGKIQKPEAFFFYQKSSINYDWQELKQDFIPKILDSVSRAPF
jgi:hypothetical protein